MNEIQEEDPQHLKKMKKILTPHFFQVMYSDAIFLFMVNGIVWILQLYRQAIGVILMVVGVVIAVTGLLASFMWRYDYGRRISTLAMLLTTIVAAAEFVLFLLIP